MPRALSASLAAVLITATACAHSGRPDSRRLVVARAVPATPGQAATAASARDRLLDVAAALRASFRKAEIRAALRERRDHNLDVLHAYRVAGRFPVNTTVPGEGHFLIDAHGRLCAVANLIAKDGHRDLVEAASRNNNALLFGNVDSGPIYAWMLTSGFTREEVARIQVPAPFVGRGRRRSSPPAPRPRVAPLVAATKRAARRKVRAYLARVEAALRANENAALDVAAARLAGRPALAAELLDRKGAPAGREIAAAAPLRFAAPPPPRIPALAALAAHERLLIFR